MEKERSRIFISTLFIIMGLIMCYPMPTAKAQDRCTEWVAKMESKLGVVQVRRAGETRWTSAKLNETYCPGDAVRTLENSGAVLLLPNEILDRLHQDTAMTFNGIEKERISLLGLIKGAFHFFSRTPRALKVTTPFVNGTVEGTEFFVRVAPDHTLISVFQGNILAANDVGSVNLASGQSAIAYAGEAPKAHIVVRPRDALQWAIYYPAVIDYKPADFSGGENWQGMVRQSIQHYRDGDLASAFSSLDSVPETIPDPRFYTYRAGLFLTVGRVDKASDDIERSLTADPTNSHAFALQSIIAVTQNRKDEALELASRAVILDPDSSAAKVALSYAYQANFQIQASLEALQDAVALSPENALAWGRLSELWMSVGDLDKALEAAQKGAALNPNLARSQTVLGFAYLAQIKTKDAKAAFEKAIALDQAAPLPRLGLGLARIREGDLEAGRSNIEIAASLDPNNSIIRSYLGKAFYEEKRDKLAADQLEISKNIDPHDPTPWFYDAMRKQTINRPVEALHDLQKAIELNDNRAVYRSRLMLDSDLAARSSSLGRIYNNLGFRQLGLAEGYKSVNTDPANFSAHRFLADTYGALPRHEIARTSELLQSQLLQPINITPIQPQLAESNLFFISRQGPSVPSANTYNPLFNRDQVVVLANGLLGGNETWGGEGIISGIYGRLSFSAGFTHFETDGFRENNDQTDDIANVLVQIELTHKTNIQAEYRYRDTQKGDLPLRFDPKNFFPTERNFAETNSVRLSLHHAFTRNSHLLASFIMQEGDFRYLEPDPFFFLDWATDENGYMGEIRHLFYSDRFHITTGAGYLDSDQESSEIWFFPPPVIKGIDVNSYNVYFYSNINFPKDLEITIGASGDSIERDYRESDDLDLDENQLSPKFGITWNPIPNTMLRAAVFRTLRRHILSDQTLEPTQVSGFNQFFDDPKGSDIWRYGIAVDQKISASFWGGVEFSKREIEVPYEDYSMFPGNPSIARTDWEEQLGRGYLYWTPASWLALSAEYQYEELERSPDFAGSERFQEIDTHRFPLGIGFFLSSGFSAQLKTTYVDQEGKFLDPFSGYLPGDDQFWVVDAAISYRLPKRWGIITLEAKNLFDEEFNFQDTDPANPWTVPERLISARATLAF